MNDGKPHLSAHRILALLILISAATGSFLYLERRFDNADIKKAIKLAKQTKANDDSPVLPQALARLHPDVAANDIVWRAEVADRCYGTVRVSASVPGAAAPVIYQFDVDVLSGRIHPGNEAAMQIMEQIRDGALPQAPASE